MLRQDAMIRWMVDSDSKRVLEIERASFSNPWTSDEMRSTRMRRDCIPLVAEMANYASEPAAIKGFLFYELHVSQFRIVNMAVDPDFRGRGIGTSLINRLIDKLSPLRRRVIKIAVSEENLQMHLFLRTRGFKAKRVLRNHSWDENRKRVDAYEFEFTLGEVV